ncbi:type 1 glutamine amidotransferase [Novipirellula artificiosorum]|uniref:type 1 glutamine amidotransferase n=1 Tax=Novipirellula artificiosorum TaxID=2528016 RepID=UPI0018CEFEF9|nr:type 1 glutamine amidotransferase [Novipirellula artificiosorum]
MATTAKPKRPTRILAIQHDAADPPGAVSEVARELGCPMEVLRMDRGDAIPAQSDADVLMSFGGGISLTDPDFVRPEWVETEQSLMRWFVQSGRKVLGICQGAQVLALSLGAEVRRNRGPEVGWHPVRRVGRQTGAASVLPDQFTALHWHRDTFDLPHGATRLFASDATENQGFAVGDRVFGFQFHLEATPRTIEIFLAVSPLCRSPSLFVQSEQQITEGAAVHLPTQRAWLVQFLAHFLSDQDKPSAPK